MSKLGIIFGILLAVCGKHVGALELELGDQGASVRIDDASTRKFLRLLKSQSQVTPDLGRTLHGVLAVADVMTTKNRKLLENSGIYVLNPLTDRIFRVMVQDSANIDVDSVLSMAMRPKLAAIEPVHRVSRRVREEFKQGKHNFALMLLSGKVSIDAIKADLDKVDGETVQVVSRLFLTKEVVRIDIQELKQLEELEKRDYVFWIQPAYEEPYEQPFLKRVQPRDRNMRATGLSSLREDSRDATPLGKSVVIGIFDRGIDSSHGDFGRNGERILIKSPISHPHGTNIAGIIAGDGSGGSKQDSCGLLNHMRGTPLVRLQGVAPKAKLLDILKGEVFLKNEDVAQRLRHQSAMGMDAMTHLYHIEKFQMDISNHSYSMNSRTFNINANGVKTSVHSSGGYDIVNYIHDGLIRGGAQVLDGRTVPPRLQVTSAGNNGSWGDKDGNVVVHAAYLFTLTKEMKNSLIVGNWDLSSSAGDFNRPEGKLLPGKLNVESSMGPTIDGRIKPDVVAPGTDLLSAAFCIGSYKDCVAPETPGERGCSEDMYTITRRGNYRAMTGTSQAAAFTTGVAALLIDAYRHGGNEMRFKTQVSPSLLRGVLIHTARPVAPFGANPNQEERKEQGPHPAVGWGLIDAHRAVNVVKERRFVDFSHDASSLIEAGDWQAYAFKVRDSEAALRVTLAWDDIPGDPSLPLEQSRLVNDLDLILIDPCGQQHYPWVFDQGRKNDPIGGVQKERQSSGMNFSIDRALRVVPTDFSQVRFPVAVRGRDRLNNVEVVDVERRYIRGGTWTAIVSASSLTGGRQGYSLVGRTFKSISSTDVEAGQGTAVCKK